MKVRNYREVSPDTELPGIALHTVISQPDGAPRFAMRVFEVQPGSSTPFHTHAWEHEVFILSGRGKVRDKDGERNLADIRIDIGSPGARIRTHTVRDLRAVCHHDLGYDNSRGGSHVQDYH